MSRALNLNIALAEVKAEADKRGIRITSIERLYPSGTRVVLANGDATAIIAKAFKASIMSGAVVRTPLRTRRAS
jgi:predicted xylose isomerase-like sugar epimerase